MKCRAWGPHCFRPKQLPTSRLPWLWNPSIPTRSGMTSIITRVDANGIGITRAGYNLRTRMPVIGNHMPRPITAVWTGRRVLSDSLRFKPNLRAYTPLRRVRSLPCATQDGSNTELFHEWPRTRAYFHPSPRMGRVMACVAACYEVSCHSANIILINPCILQLPQPRKPGGTYCGNRHAGIWQQAIP